MVPLAWTIGTCTLGKITLLKILTVNAGGLFAAVISVMCVGMIGVWMTVKWYFLVIFMIWVMLVSI